MADVKKQMEPSSSIRPEVITENQAIGPVSYTHLDVYKRQVRCSGSV